MISKANRLDTIINVWTKNPRDIIISLLDYRYNRYITNQLAGEQRYGWITPTNGKNTCQRSGRRIVIATSIEIGSTQFLLKIPNSYKRKITLKERFLSTHWYKNYCLASGKALSVASGKVLSIVNKCRFLTL